MSVSRKNPLTAPFTQDQQAFKSRSSAGEHLIPLSPGIFERPGNPLSIYKDF